MAVLFISDLHLRPDAPHHARILLDFLRGPAADAEALYVLGDLFEAWPGDDDAADPFHAPVVDAFRTLTAHGVPVRFQRGNRDFLLGTRFARDTGSEVLPDEVVLDLDGTPTLVMHGDQLCTDDLAYQRFRRIVRNRPLQHAWLALPLKLRKRLASKLRKESETARADKPVSIMDVNEDAVASAFRRHDVARIVHGHTHRPAIHRHDVDGKPRERIVLADWRERGEYVRIGRDGVTRHAIG